MTALRCLPAALLLCAATLLMPARADTVKITFLLTNDIHKVDNTSGRGGIARLNAVVTAERARGGHVIYAHAGDLISPSLPETQAKADADKAELDKDLNITIGTTSEPLDSREATLRTQEAAMGNLVADALREAVKADVAIINGGGIRGNKEYPAGSPLTRRDVLTELPFGNRTVKLEVTGETIWAALEHGVSGTENAAGRFPQVSGLVLEADLMKPKGQRVIAVTIGGKPLDRAASYTLATTDHMFAGGDGYTALSAGKPLLGLRDGQLMANDVMAYVIRLKTVSPKVEGRIWLRM
jgi:2',3'-cyclic-nucleotide 2'-phosphodiesterase (5'-nucleotidase family)